MTNRLRQIHHPGPPAGARICALPCHATPLHLTLRAGQSLTAAMSDAFAQAGFTFGYLRLDGAPFSPMHFVTPAPAPGDGHAAWYSATQRVPAARTRHGGAHLGLRDGKPFVHCHGVWERAGALPDMGHMLCDDSILAQDCTLAGWGLSGAGLVAQHDDETDFTLFRPGQAGETATANAFVITLRPNQDIRAALLAFAREHRIDRARIEGLGSLVGTAFNDGRAVDSYATEILILNGQLNGKALSLEVSSTGFDGAGHSGILAADPNAICVTAEILLLVGSDAARGAGTARR